MGYPAAELLKRLVWCLLALAAGGACAWLALHHPLLGAWALLPCALAMLVELRSPGSWPLWLLPLWSSVGWMPWTGWLAVEEVDLLVLATAAGGYLAWSFAATAVAERTRPGRAGLPGLMLLLAYGTALAVSLERGVVDAGGWTLGWWQGYHESSNALRLAKSFLWAMLLVPLWLRAHRLHPLKANARVQRGLTLTVLLVSLWVVYERLAYTGLADFSSDYRATGPFWEMHVGGAALDAALALTGPFAVALLQRPAGAVDWAIAAAATLLGAYASLVTFSRVVYVAVPVGLAVLLLLRPRSSRGSTERPPPDERSWLATPALLLAFAATAAVVFGEGGYRGLTSALGLFGLALPAVPGMRELPARSKVAAAVGGLAFAAVAAICAVAVSKGAYAAELALALVGVACAVAAALGRQRGDERLARRAAVGLAACTLGLCAALYLVVAHWGGANAQPGGAVVSIVLAVALLGFMLRGGTSSPWPRAWRWQASRLAMFVATGLAVAVFSGGGYMSGRWAAFGEDLGVRLEKVHTVLALVRDPVDAIFGRGLGRYPATQFMSGTAQDQTGDYRWLDDAEGQRLLLTAGKHIQGWGELFRMSQRVDPPGASARVVARVRVTQAPVELHAEVCEKHLLYSGTCISGDTMMKTAGRDWQEVEWRLEGEAAPTRGNPLAPRFLTFSIALSSAGARAEFDRIELLGADGRQLLVNPSFANGGARWFFSSDHHHMPWHAKNLLVHLAFEQGLVGLVLFLSMVGLALWRLTFGEQRRRTLSAALAAALAGVMIVGSADSILDMPRIAFLLYVLLAISLLQRPGSLSAAGVGRPRRRHQADAMPTTMSGRLDSAAHARRRRGGH